MLPLPLIVCMARTGQLFKPNDKTVLACPSQIRSVSMKGETLAINSSNCTALSERALKNQLPHQQASRGIRPPVWTETEIHLQQCDFFARNHKCLIILLMGDCRRNQYDIPPRWCSG
jgi:hypothetical protein